MTSRGAQYDDILIDVGTADSFLTGGQLLPEVRHLLQLCCSFCVSAWTIFVIATFITSIFNYWQAFEKAATQAGQKVTLRYQVRPLCLHLAS